MTAVAWLAASYLLGAIPTSYLVARAARGIDLRQVGSRNLGATNLYRVLGWRYAVPVGLVDLLKGAVPVLVFAPLAAGGADGAAAAWLAMGCGLAAVLGHVYSVFVRFRGGKGVATGAGVVLGLAPLAFLAALAVWLAVVRITGYVSLGSVLAAAMLPPAAAFLYPDRTEVFWLFLVLAALVVVLHHANLRRLVAGTEHRFGRRGRPATSDASTGTGGSAP